MYPIITVVIISVVIIALVRFLRRQPPSVRRSLLIQYGCYGIIGLTILLAVTGRIHWLGAAIAAVIPAISKLAVWGWRLLPFFQQWRNHNKGKPHKPRPTAAMDYDEALELFGLTAKADKQQIIQRHRELMQRNHPDRGGSNYLAAKINEAKKILLAAVEK